MWKGRAGVQGAARVGASSWLLLILGVALIMTLGAVPPGLSGVAPGMPEALNIPADGIQAGSARAAGQLPGRWAVTPTGGFTYTLPLDIPAGRAGMQPSLTLTYASGGGNGHLGVGWSLAGLSAISRCTRNLAEDGLSDGVDFDAEDRFCLDGMKLVTSSSSNEPSYGQSLVEYRTEADSHVKVVSYGTDARGPWRFKAYLPGGIERMYEAHNVARHEGRLPGNLPGPEDDGGLLDAESQVRLVWLLKTDRDLHGNTIEYRYGASDDGSEWWPEQIDYTGHEDGTPALRSVKFVYAPDNQPRLDREVSWLSGVMTLVTRRLAAIEMHAPSPATTEMVWRYNLAYASPGESSTGRSLLRSVQKCGALGTCLLKKEFTYSIYGNNVGGGSFPSFQTTEVAAATLPPQGPGDAFSIDKPVIHVLDANGDGADDLLFQLGEAKVRYLRSQRTDDGQVDALAVESEIVGDASYDMLWLARSMPVDIDDDGRAELFGVRWPLAPGDRNFSVYQVDPTRFVTKQADVVVPLDYNDGSIEQAAAHYFIDTDGDGQVELIRRSFTEEFNDDPQDPAWFIGETELDIWHNDGGVLVGPSSLGSFAEHSRCTGNVVDLDGDGRGEVVMPRSGNDNECSATTAIALGRDDSGALVLTNSRAATDEGHRFIGRTALYGDVNGDGLVDRIADESVAINTGNGFYYPGGFNHQGQVVVDINNDGKADLLEFETGQSPTIKAWVSNGFELIEHDLGLIPGDPSGGEETYSRVGDFTGDGKVDIVVFTGGKVLLHEQVSPSKPDLLMLVRDEGAGWPDVDVTYSDRWWEGRHGPMPSCDHPLHCVKRGLTVVKEVALREHLVDPVNINAGVRTLHYSYDDPVSDDGGRGFLGFGTFRVWDPSRPQETVIRYGHRYDSGFMSEGTFLHGGRPKSIRVATPILDMTGGAPNDGVQGADTRVVLTELAYDTWLGDGGTYQLLMGPYAAAFQTYQIVPARSTVKEWEQHASIDWGNDHDEHIFGIQEPSAPLRRSVSTVDDFDAELGVARRTTASVDGGSTVVTEILYDRLLDQRYLTALPRSVTTTVADAAGRQVSRQVEMAHDVVNGLLERTTVAPGLGEAYEQSTYYDYHPIYGVLIGTMREAAGAGNRREQRIEYAPLVAGAPDELIYPSQVWAPRAGGAAQPSRWFAVHPGHGVLLAAMDANGVQTETKYDDLGRVLYRKADGAVAVSYSYQPRVEASGATNGLLIDTAIGGASARVSIGGAGQTLATWKKGFDGGYIVQTYEHDVLGRTRRVSRPSDNGAPAAFTTLKLDSLDRLLEVLHPDGTTSRQEHTFFTTRSFDALDNESYMVRDVHGRVMTSAQVIDGAGVATEYGYAPDGAVEAVTDAYGNVTRFTHDALGRRVWQLEPDAGETELVYNGLGELVRRTRAGAGGSAAEEETYLYDDLGRLVEKESPDGVTTFTWDTATHGIGKLHAAQSPDGFAAVYSYDDSGRGARVTYEHEGSTYAFDMAYDGLGQLEKVYYPEVPGRQRFAVKYTYNGLGYLSEVGDATGNGYTRLWRVDARNADGLLEQGVFGPNNVVTLTRTYDALTGRVDRVRALGFGGNLLDLDYDYKANGLVQRRFDLVSQREEIFDYDEAGRITDWILTQNGATTPTAYRYDDLGNLTEVWKNGALAERNTYGNADGSLPHALTERHLPVVNQHDAYGYDELGRNTTGGGRTGAAYTMFDLPRVLERGADRWTFAYDAFGGRVKRSGSDGTIVYIDDLYEKRSAAGGTKHLFHVEGTDGKVGQVVYDEGTGAEAVEYQVHDALGSTGVVFGQNGAVLERMFNEPFGQRIEADGTSFVAPPKNTLDGFTGHEMEHGLGLINMRGRMYDPVIRRFLTPDPVVTNPLNGQDWNTYSYVRNSPLNRVDPSGYTHCTTGLAGEPADYNGACGSGASGGGGTGGGTAGGTGAAAVGAGQGFHGGDGNPGTDSTGGGGRGVGLGKGDQRPKGGNFVGGASRNAEDGGSPASDGERLTLDWPVAVPRPKYGHVQLVPELKPGRPRPPFVVMSPPSPEELEESLLEVNLLVEELRRKNDDYFARMWVHDVIYDPAIRAEFAVGLWEPFYWRWKAVHLRIAGEGMLMAAGGPVLRGGLGLGARLILRSAPNVTRALVAADLGLSGNGIAALEGTFIDAGGVRAMHVGYIEATSRGALLAEVRGALPNILNAARADGIRTLQISGTFANKGFSRFAAGQTTQYGGMISSVNGVETFTFILF